MDKGPKGLFCERLILGRYILLNIYINVSQILNLRVVLCGCENWSIIFNEERTIRLFENRMPMGYLVLTRAW
jgi:hypothetical protein